MRSTSSPRRAAVAVALAFAVMAAMGSSVACKRPSPAKTDAVTVPPGEVWLTTAQIQELKVTVAKVDEQVIEDTLITAGEVTFDDQKVSHVFSPVNGRVTTVLVELGST